MHFKHIIIGLLLIFMVSKSHSKATDPPIFYEDEDSPNSVEDDYYSDEEIETETSSSSSIQTNHSHNVSITTTTTESIVMITTTPQPPPPTTTAENKIIDTTSLSLPKLSLKCPDFCDCKNDNQFVNCSLKNLHTIPNNIPQNVLILDLSYNLIEELHNDSFHKYENIQELILTENAITNIDEKVFSKLHNLTKVMLDSNLLTSIHPNTFSNAKHLKMLNLSNNEIEITENVPFLNQNYLKELYLSNNSLKEVFNQTFDQLIGLKVLSLDSNDFNQKINTKAFEPLKELTQLKLPNLNEDTIKELCETLTSIDVVNFEKFDISCFELTSGQTFGESIITVKPNTMEQGNLIDESRNGTSRVGLENNKEIMMTTSSREIKTNNTLVILGNATQTSAGSSLTSTLLNNESSSKFNESLSHLEESYLSNKIEDNNEDNEKTYQVAISSQTINHILIAIIVVAIIGLLIGVVCRKDLFGIKTKLCRTKRPPSTDQVRPAEEVPLNKIV